MPNFIKPPKVQGLPDIVTVDEAQRLFSATRTLSYRVFYFTPYSMGLRLSEGLALKVGDQCHPQNASMSNQRAAFLRAGAGLPAQAVVGLLAPGAAP